VHINEKQYNGLLELIFGVGRTYSQETDFTAVYLTPFLLVNCLFVWCCRRRTNCFTTKWEGHRRLPLREV